MEQVNNMLEEKIRQQAIEKLKEQGFITSDGNMINAQKAFTANRIILWALQRLQNAKLTESQLYKINKGLQGYKRGDYTIVWRKEFPTFRKKSVEAK